MSNQTIQLLIRFLEQDPNDSFTRFALAMEYNKAGQTDLAKETYLELISRNPEYVGTYYHLGMMYALNGQKEDARRIFEDGIRIAGIAKDNHAASELRQALTELDF
jgi:tetratricopeptide (TPR) repeat protein